MCLWRNFLFIRVLARLSFLLSIGLVFCAMLLRLAADQRLGAAVAVVVVTAAAAI